MPSICRTLICLVFSTHYATQKHCASRALRASYSAACSHCRRSPHQGLRGCRSYYSLAALHSPNAANPASAPAGLGHVRRLPVRVAASARPEGASEPPCGASTCRGSCASRRRSDRPRAVRCTQAALPVLLVCCVASSSAPLHWPRCTHPTTEPCLCQCGLGLTVVYPIVSFAGHSTFNAESIDDRCCSS